VTAQAGEAVQFRRMPWQQDKEPHDDYPQTFAEARKRAGLMWDPVGIPAVMRVYGDPELRNRFREIVIRSAAQPLRATIDDLMDLYQESVIPDREYRRIARSDTRKSLSYQRDSYNIIPNLAFGQIIDGLIEAGGGKVTLVAGGPLAGGRKVWMTVRLEEPWQIPGDSSLTFPYLVITSSHDGHASCAARLTTIRVICANMFSAAEAEGRKTGLAYSFSHRGDYRRHLEEAREALLYGRAQFRNFTQAMGSLAGIKVTPGQESLFIREFIPVPPGDGIVSDRTAKNIQEAREAILMILQSPTVGGAGLRGTAAGLVQAAGEYLDHVRTARTPASRLDRSFIRPQPRGIHSKQRAVQLAREAAKS